MLILWKKKLPKGDWGEIKNGYLVSSLCCWWFFSIYYHFDPLPLPCLWTKTWAKQYNEKCLKSVQYITGKQSRKLDVLIHWFAPLSKPLVSLSKVPIVTVSPQATWVKRMFCQFLHEAKTSIKTTTKTIEMYCRYHRHVHHQLQHLTNVRQPLSASLWPSFSHAVNERLYN